MNEGIILDLGTQVQHNCHISDARHGGDYAMCTYLMKMREYYRWEKQLPYGERLPKEDVGCWLAEREQLWEELFEQDYAPLRLTERRFDPFDSDAVNRSLQPLGLVYSAGLGRNAKPHFFLGKLERQSHPGDCLALISNREYARDLGAPAAMSQGSTIFVRRESLRQMLWEKLESWRWNRPDNALGRAFSCYDFEEDFDRSLDAMSDAEIDMALLHETGEYQSGKRLGDDEWNSMLSVVFGSPAELMARAVRDHLADCLVTLPALAQRAEAASIHFYLGNLTHMRKSLFPALPQAYEKWRVDGSTAGLRQLAEQGAIHWEDLAERMLRVYRRGDRASLVDDLEHLVESAHL